MAGPSTVFVAALITETVPDRFETYADFPSGVTAPPKLPTGIELTAVFVTVLITEMPDTGFPWQEEWAVNMKCTNGADAGVEVIFKATTDGALKAVVLMVDQVRDRINGGQHDGKIVPIVLLEKDSYPHPQYGKVWVPVLTIIDWMPLDGPAPVSEPAPQPPSSNQGGASERLMCQR